MKACSEKPLCVVSILPHILDCGASCRNDYLSILARLGEKYKNKMWGLVAPSSREFNRPVLTERLSPIYTTLAS